MKINKKIVFEAENAKLPTSSPDVINGETTLPGKYHTYIIQDNMFSKVVNKDSILLHKLLIKG